MELTVIKLLIAIVALQQFVILGVVWLAMKRSVVQASKTTTEPKPRPVAFHQGAGPMMATLKEST